MKQDTKNAEGTREPLLNVGFSRQEMLPRLPFPLAGTVNRQARLSGRVESPPQVRTVAFEQGSKRVALCLADILIVDTPLYEAVQERGRQRGFDGVFLVASHTHSSFGGYVNSRGGSLFMGRFRPELQAFLHDRIDASLAGAAADLSPVSKIESGHMNAPGLTMNRRVKGGPTDDRIIAARYRRRRGGPVIIASVSGHPVVSCFFEPNAVSSDFPGRVAGLLEQSVAGALVLPGGLGGLNVIFPEFPTSLEDHLSLVTTIATDGIWRALQAPAESPSRKLHYGAEPLSFTMKFPPLTGGPPRVRATSLATAALGGFFARFTAPAHLTVPVVVLGAGPLAVAGMPADFGIVATRLLRDRLAASGAPCPVVTSHSNGYVGYLHLAHEHNYRPEMNLEFLYYENAMNWYGIDSAKRLMDAADGLCRTQRQP